MPLLTRCTDGASPLSRKTTMGLFRRPNYESDATQFILQLKAQKPELAAQQRQGRALLWDQQVDRQAQAEFKAGRVAQKPYVYQTQA
jgi:nitrogen fixation protein FixH